MKIVLSLCACVVLLSGCVSAGSASKLVRVVPENKDFEATIQTIYGNVHIVSHVSSNYTGYPKPK